MLLSRLRSTIGSLRRRTDAIAVVAWSVIVVALAAYALAQTVTPPYQPPPPITGWTPHDWQIFLLSLLLFERLVFWFWRIGTWFNQRSDPNAPVTRLELKNELSDERVEIDRVRTEAARQAQEQLKRVISQIQNEIVLEIRPFRAEVNQLAQTMQTIAQFERMRYELIEQLRHERTEKKTTEEATP